MEHIAPHVHKRYSLVRVEDGTGDLLEERCLQHAKGVFRAYLGARPPGSPVAVETTGNWYWAVDEIEAAGRVPRLTHAYLAEKMIGGVHKSDRLDCRGLNRLQRSGTSPTVWIAPAEMRERRALPRTRMALVASRARLKNRIHGMSSRAPARRIEAGPGGWARQHMPRSTQVAEAHQCRRGPWICVFRSAQDAPRHGRVGAVAKAARRVSA